MTKRKAIPNKEEEIELDEVEAPEIKPKAKPKKIDFDKPVEEIDDELVHSRPTVESDLRSSKPHSQVPDMYIRI